MTDFSKIRKEFIPASQVPEARRIPSEWDEIFKGIPKGQALVLHEPEIHSGTVREALRARQRHGKFKNIRVSTRGAKGKAAIYVINTDKPVTTPRAALQQGAT